MIERNFNIPFISNIALREKTDTAELSSDNYGA